VQTETARIDIAKPPAEVWALVGEFGGLDTWMAGVDSCVVEGDVRTIQTMGMTLTEQLVGRDDAARAITYSIVGEGKPVESHEATITVHETDGGSEVTWDVSIEPDAAAAMFKDIYQGALGELKAKLEG
jgi:carbon monoxide dehydrogenase subunit G